MMEIERGTRPINGAELYYEVAGRGEFLLLVHAGIADGRMWEPQFEALASLYRVCRLDLRGYGRSPMVAGDFSHLHDLAAFIDAFGTHPMKLVGCSFGGSLCLDYALAHPERLSALVLVGASPSGFQFEGERPKQWDALVAADKTGNLERISELEIEIWVDGPQRGPKAVDRQIRQLAYEMNLIALQTEAAELGNELEAEHTAVDRLSEVAVPTLVIYGDLDQPRILEAGQNIFEGIPEAQRVIIKGAAHLPNLERPQLFTQLLLDFFS